MFAPKFLKRTSLDRLFNDPERLYAGETGRFVTAVSVRESERFFVDLFAAVEGAFLPDVCLAVDAVGVEPLKSLLKLPRSWLLAHVTNAARIVAMSQKFLFTAGMLTTT